MVDSLGGLTCEVNAIEADAGNPVPLRLALHPVDSGDLFLFHKTTHRAVYETAKGNHGSDCFDVLLWNERREVTEGTFGNIAVEMDGRLWTPPLESGLLAGTYRQHLIDRGELQERVIRVDDLADCSRIVWMNSVRGLKEAVLLDQSFEGQKWL